MAFCATLAKMAFRSSWKAVAPMRVMPSCAGLGGCLWGGGEGGGGGGTCEDDGAGGGPDCAGVGEEVDVHRVDDCLEEEGDLDIEDLSTGEYV